LIKERKMNNSNALTEEEILTDMLTSEKDLVKLYATALTEMTNNRLRTQIKKFLGEVADEQYKIFSTMQEKGYYQVAPAQKQKIDSTLDKFTKKTK